MIQNEKNLNNAIDEFNKIQKIESTKQAIYTLEDAWVITWIERRCLLEKIDDLIIQKKNLFSENYIK